MFLSHLKNELSFVDAEPMPVPQSSVWTGHKVTSSPSQSQAGVGFFFAPQPQRRRHLDSSGREFPRPTQAFKSWWNRPVPGEDVIDGQEVKYYVHFYGLRKQKCRVEVKEGPAYLESYVTKTHQAASSTLAKQNCLDEIEDRIHRYEAVNRQKPNEAIITAPSPDFKKLEEEEKKPPSPEEALANEITDMTTPLPKSKEGKPFLKNPGKVIRKTGKEWRETGKRLQERSEFFEKLSNGIGDIGKSLENGDPSKAKDFYKKNPEVKKDLKNASQEERVDWFKAKELELNRLANDCTTSGQRHKFLGHIFETGGTIFENEITRSPQTLNNMAGVTVGNHLIAYFEGKEDFDSIGKFALVVGQEAVEQTAQTIAEQVAYDTFTATVAEYTGQSLPGLGYVRIAHHGITSLSESKDIADFAVKSGQVGLKVSTQLVGQLAGSVLVPIPFVGPFIGPLAGVFVTRGIDYGIERGVEYFQSGS